MTFRRANGGHVKLGPNAEKKFKDHAQRTGDGPESGGVLLGRIVDGTDDVIVTDVSTPTKDDRSGRFFFFRGLDRAQRLVHETWKSSGGTEIYLGEWHTHPQDVPVPSPHDRANWNRIVNDAKFEQDFLLFVIVGRVSTSLWELNRNQSQAYPLDKGGD